MFITAVASIIVSAVIGLVIKYFMKGGLYNFHISRREFAAGLALISLLIAPSITWIGNKISVDQALQYQEFWNGVEVSAERHEILCQPGRAGSDEWSGYSNCDYQYNTGQTYTYSYTVTETYSCTGADGKSTTCTRLKTVYDTAYIFYPYTRSELTYSISDSLGGTYEFPTTYIASNATPYDSVPIPSDIPRGEPSEWTESKRRIEAGDPRGVTSLETYDNYILAAKDDMLLPFSQDVDRYLSEGILPEHTANIMNDPTAGYNDRIAHKLSFVGVSVSDESTWQESLMEFNGALGSTLRGDLHMVIVDSKLVDNPNTYTYALKAYWAGEAFNRRAIAKNAIIVILGVDNNEVTWARASTGMPFGNETMIRAVENFLPGAELTPEAIFGNPVPVFGEDDTTLKHDEQMGALEEIIFKSFPFVRASMSCSDADDGGCVGYGNLIAKIKPPLWQHFVMIGIVAIISFGWWYFVAANTLFEHKTQTAQYSSRRNVRPYYSNY